MHMVCTDLEGILVPEIWINVAERRGINELRLTTRDISDYDVLMKKRLSILEENSITLGDITDVIEKMEPLDGALEFLNWLRSVTQVIVVSDTYVEFAAPLMKKLGYPTLLCHDLTIDGRGMISGYNIRMTNAKRHAVAAFKGLNYKVTAIGDSYNDTSMLKEADYGILFCPPENVKKEFPDFPVAKSYPELKEMLKKILA